MSNVRTKGEVDVQFVFDRHFKSSRVPRGECGIGRHPRREMSFAWEDIQALRYEFSSFYSEAFVIIS